MSWNEHNSCQLWSPFYNLDMLLWCCDHIKNGNEKNSLVSLHQCVNPSWPAMCWKRRFKWGIFYRNRYSFWHNVYPGDRWHVDCKPFSHVKPLRYRFLSQFSRVGCKPHQKFWIHKIPITCSEGRAILNECGDFFSFVHQTREFIPSWEVQ